MIQLITKLFQVENDPLLLRNRTSILYGHLKIAAFTNIVVGILYATVMLNVIPRATIFFWLLALCVFSVLRYFMAYRYAVD